MPTRYEGDAATARALDAFIKLSRAAEALHGRLQRSLAGSGLTMGQFAVLEALLHLGPLNPCELGRKLLRSGGNMTTVLDNLERDGLIRRERSAEDRRRLSVHLTPAGRARIEAIFPAHAARIAAAMSALGPAEQAELGRLCKTLGLAAVAEPDPAAPDPDTSGAR